MKQKPLSGPFRHLARRSLAEELSEAVQALQKKKPRPVSEDDVLDFLFTPQRGDPDTVLLEQKIRRSLREAVRANRIYFFLKSGKRRRRALGTVPTDEEPLRASGPRDPDV